MSGSGVQAPASRAYAVGQRAAPLKAFSKGADENGMSVQTHAFGLVVKLPSPRKSEVAPLPAQAHPTYAGALPVPAAAVSATQKMSSTSQYQPQQSLGPSSTPALPAEAPAHEAPPASEPPSPKEPPLMRRGSDTASRPWVTAPVADGRDAMQPQPEPAAPAAVQAATHKPKRAKGLPPMPTAPAEPAGAAVAPMRPDTAPPTSSAVQRTSAPGASPTSAHPQPQPLTPAMVPFIQAALAAGRPISAKPKPNVPDGTAPAPPPTAPLRAPSPIPGSGRDVLRPLTRLGPGAPDIARWRASNGGVLDVPARPATGQAMAFFKHAPPAATGSTSASATSASGPSAATGSGAAGSTTTTAAGTIRYVQQRPASSPAHRQTVSPAAQSRAPPQAEAAVAAQAGNVAPPTAPPARCAAPAGIRYASLPNGRLFSCCIVSLMPRRICCARGVPCIYC